MESSHPKRFVLSGALMATLVLLMTVGVHPASATGAGDTVTTIWTDFGGVWRSNVDTSIPDTDQNLLAFTTSSGTVFSTGVNDAALTGVTFTPATWRAFPVAGGLPTTSATNYFVARGFSAPDKPGFSANPTSAQLAAFLTDGTNGLNLGSGITNIPRGTSVSLDVAGGVNLGAIGDSVPDILITQIANPDAGNQDVLEFRDANNNLVGSQVQIDQSASTSIVRPSSLKSLAVHYYLIPTAVPPGSPFTFPTSNDVRLRTYELSEFGITSANRGSVAKLVWTAAGSSDPAFFAYNTASLSFTAEDPPPSEPSAPPPAEPATGMDVLGSEGGPADSIRLDVLATNLPPGTPYRLVIKAPERVLLEGVAPASGVVSQRVVIPPDLGGGTWTAVWTAAIAGRSPLVLSQQFTLASDRTVVTIGPTAVGDLSRPNNLPVTGFESDNLLGWALVIGLTGMFVFLVSGQMRRRIVERERALAPESP